MEWIAPLIGIVALGGMLLTGLRMWLHRPQRSRDLPAADLHERMDFAERLLTKGE